MTDAETTRESTVGELSEGQILRGILDRLPPSTAPVGPGDDAAVLAVPDGRVVATTDTLVHGPDFRLAWSSPFDLGFKAAAVNLADVAAMGARPVALLVALAMPDATPVSFVRGFADGLAAACAELAPGCAVEGGDLTVSDTLTIAVTALGSLDGRDPVRRSGARVGDGVYVIGELGEAARGLEVLFRRFTDADGAPVPLTPEVREALDPTDARAVLRQLAPRPPLAEALAAAASGATAMMDISDGLVLDATRLADASDVTIEIDSATLGDEPARALDGGEDHGFLVTFPPDAEPRGRRIGTVVARDGEAVRVDGRAWDGLGGWDPYRDWDAGRG
ncbi:thiamine-monophosphate kinase [Microbacterium sp. ru370.1]|uniref:thiamine-phosphate kinase n=1 Tax=unclassified Microbacterium TaxID=2609290 RepID=UPI00088B854D|nr:MULTISPECIES: thiamine-phosphate kinase [unclassified Microbacterium]SDO81081.1 thiamine-monophosphate kinase [Microbacterium sp. ru370.1]SIT89739.1 thiamine-monophosphate kinase [Microbacterium sp. RU1D]